MKQMLLRGAAFLALALALIGANLPVQAFHALPLLQETETDTPTSTQTASLTPTETPTGSLTPSISASPSASADPSGTVTNTGTPPTQPPATSVLSTPTPTVSPTSPLPPTLPVFTPAQPPTVTPRPQFSPVPLETLPSATPAPETATLIPFPQVTYQYPGRTPTHSLLARQGENSAGSPPKNDGFSIRRTWNALVRVAPWLLLGALWIGLGAWFVISQILLHRSK